MRRGNLFIVSAPSGTGKTTLVKRLVRSVPDLVMSRSYTSRPPRVGETDGVDYNFIDSQRFTAMVDGGEFLEWATVFGHRYGTGAAETEQHRRQGRDVVLVIDVQGASKVRRRVDDVVGVFVLPPSFHVLEARLRGRSGAQADEDDLRRRLDIARDEVAAREDYDYVVVNHNVDDAVDRLRCIVLAERSRTAAMNEETAPVIESFSE